MKKVVHSHQTVTMKPDLQLLHLRFLNFTREAKNCLTVATNVVICHALGTFLLQVVWLKNVNHGVQIGQRDGQITFFQRYWP